MVKYIYQTKRGGFMKNIIFKLIAFALLFAMLGTALVGCSKKNETEEATEAQTEAPKETDAPVVEEVVKPEDEEEEEEEEIDLRHPANRRYEYSDFVPLSQAAAAEGMVLLKNEDECLPLIYDENVALVGDCGQ